MDFLSHSFPLLVCPLRLSRWAVVQNFKFTRNCLLRSLFRCGLLGGCLLGCGFCRGLGGCLLGCLLRRRCWGGPGGCINCSGRLLLSNGDDDVCEPALIAERTAHWSGANALHTR